MLDYGSDHEDIIKIDSSAISYSETGRPVIDSLMQTLRQIIRQKNRNSNFANALA